MVSSAAAWGAWLVSCSSAAAWLVTVRSGAGHGVRGKHTRGAVSRKAAADAANVLSHHQSLTQLCLHFLVIHLRAQRGEGMRRGFMRAAS